jgi:tetratricopeptide (TPR) repeat protein
MKENHINILSLAVMGSLILLSSYNAAEAEICEDWIAKIVSVQGSVEARVKGQTSWTPVHMNRTFCTGDMISVKGKSRAALVMANETVIRLDQNTTVTFNEAEKKEMSLIDLVTGAVHFISRVPRTLKFNTPFVNGTVEGTEFLVRVYKDQTIVSVFEGQVTAENNLGSLMLASGQSAIAKDGQSPVSHVMVRPRDAVQWALYYPRIIYYSAADFSDATQSEWQANVRSSIQSYLKGDLAGALSSIEEIPERVTDPGFLNYRASLLLSVGRVNEAGEDIEQALKAAPGNSTSIALRSIIAVVQNEKEKALRFAEQAVERNPDSATSHIALSYARQARFDLEGALRSIRRSVNLEPQNGLSWARLAELQLSFRELDKALEAARKAADLNPGIARTQTVLGFAYLMQVKTEEAIDAFEEAVVLDQADPLPRLGLGLAQIRKGKLKEGRRQIEIAAVLDPNNSLIRSYLGKGYYEEKRGTLAAAQFEMAEDLDPYDPTPHLYSAIQEQTENRPVEALHDMQKSIELNDNRAIYRSKQLLDEDLAARSASLARIYNNLGFEQLALVEGWKSVDTDPGNYSAHRFLADSYAALPRHEIARVSELLQSQLLQPLNITPVQPSLGESDLLILDGAGPGDLSFNEFNPLFNRDRVALQFSGVAGDNNILGNEFVISGVYKKVAFSIGQFHYESDGFRRNNDLDEDIYNIFAQVNLSHKTSVQAEFRYTEIEKGDLPLRFDINDFTDSLRQNERTHSLRLGLHHAISTNSDIIGSFIYGKYNFNSTLKADPFTISLPPPPFGPGAVQGQIDFDFATDEDQRYLAEIQHLYHSEEINITTGIGHFNADRDDINIINSTFQPEAPFFGIVNSSSTSSIHSGIRHSNFYLYSMINYPKNVILTLGGSVDHVQDRTLKLDLDRLNPKLGLTWNPFPDTTFRAAVFRVVKRTLITNQTIEPTQVAGFNQFYDDDQGTVSWRYGIGIDQKFSSSLNGGIELSERELEVSRIVVTINQVQDYDWREQQGRGYLYWTPNDWLALSSEYLFERFDRDPEYTGVEDFMEIQTNRIPFGISFFHSAGLSARLKATYIEQKGEFGNLSGGFVQERDSFWVTDASIEYRLPKRWGIFTVEVRNLFDEEIKFQDTDPANPSIYPERLLLAKFTLSF